MKYHGEINIATSCYFVFQAYEKQIKDLNKMVKKLEEEKDLMSLDVGARYVAWEHYQGS